MRRLEEKKYTKSELEPTDETTFAVEVPGEEIYTSQLDYYIIAENRSGEVIARAGRKSDPNNVVVMGSGDDDKKRKPKDPEEDEDDESSKAIFVDLSVGTGEGYLTGGENNSPTANPTRPVTQGFAFTGGHVNLGFGAMLGKQMQLGLEFRVQFAPPQDFDILEGTSSVDPGNGFWDTKVPCFGLGAPVECMARLKFKYFFEDSIFFTTVGTGVGRLRNLLQLRSSATNKSCINQPTEVEDGKEFCFVRDTVRNGWFHFGLGAGVNIPLNNTFSLYIDTFAMVLLPDTSVNIDLQGGLQMRF